MPSKATTKRVLRDTALHALASLYPDTHRQFIGDNDINELLLRAADEITELRKRAKVCPRCGGDIEMKEGVGFCERCLADNALAGILEVTDGRR